MVLLKYLKIYLETDLKIILFRSSKQLCRTLKYNEQCCTKFWRSSNQFERCKTLQKILAFS